jgi:hypothetical protein
MMLIELFVPKGALTEERRRRVGQRLLAELTHVEGAPPAVLDAARALWHVVVHEPDAWIAGGRPVEPTEPARYFVRMSVPSDGSSLTDEVRAGYVSTITRVLAETDEDPQRLYREPHAWVHIIDVPEGSFGALGRAMRNADIIKMVMGTAGTAPDAASPRRARVGHGHRPDLRHDRGADRHGHRRGTRRRQLRLLQPRMPRDLRGAARGISAMIPTAKPGRCVLIHAGPEPQSGRARRHGPGRGHGHRRPGRRARPAHHAAPGQAGRRRD